jgi:hypothetical protein
VAYFKKVLEVLIHPPLRRLLFLSIGTRAWFGSFKRFSFTAKRADAF